MRAWRKQRRLFPPGNRREESVTKDHVAFTKWQSRPENGKALISRASKVVFKILQARLQQYMNHEIPDVEAGFRKTRDQIANIHWIIEKEFQKNIYFCFIDYAKGFVWIKINCGKCFKRWEYQITWPASWEICMQQQLELDMEQQTGSK